MKEDGELGYSKQLLGAKQPLGCLASAASDEYRGTWVTSSASTRLQCTWQCVALAQCE